MLVATAVFFLMLSRRVDPVMAIAVGVVAVVLAALLIRLELFHSDPVLQPRFFKLRGFAAPSVGVATSNLSMYSLLLVIPLLLTSRGSHSELEIGLILSSLSVGMALMTPIGGRLSDRFGRRAPAMIGLTLMALATLLPAVTGSDIGVLPLVAALSVVGLGLGISNAGMRTSAVESISARNAGSAAGVYSTSRYFGSIVGSAILAGLVGVERSSAGGISEVFIVVAVMASTAAIAALFMVARPAVED
jgi:DHA2 family methylenomycin A resistance protein-like MFS transporter